MGSNLYLSRRSVFPAFWSRRIHETSEARRQTGLEVQISGSCCGQEERAEAPEERKRKWESPSWPVGICLGSAMGCVLSKSSKSGVWIPASFWFCVPCSEWLCLKPNSGSEWAGRRLCVCVGEGAYGEDLEVPEESSSVEERVGEGTITLDTGSLSPGSHRFSAVGHCTPCLSW